VICLELVFGSRGLGFVSGCYDGCFLIIFMIGVVGLFMAVGIGLSDGWDSFMVGTMAYTSFAMVIC